MTFLNNLKDSRLTWFPIAKKLNRLSLVCMLLLLSMMFHTTSFATTMEEAAKKLEAMTWYTEEYPPYNFANEEGLPTGMAVDILLAAFEKMDVKLSANDLKIISWNRSYKYVQRKPGTALFSMTYTPEREKILKLVGPAIPLSISIIAPKQSKIIIRSTDDLNQLKIGVVSNDIGDQLIKKLSLNNAVVKRISNSEQLFSLLKTGKVDVVAYSVDVFKTAIKKAGGNPSHYDGVHVLHEGQSGYAFHNSTDQSVLDHLQHVIDGLKSDGTIAKIIAGYNN